MAICFLFIYYDKAKKEISETMSCHILNITNIYASGIVNLRILINRMSCIYFSVADTKTCEGAMLFEQKKQYDS